jgi:ClpX C4-type zinc finger
VLSSFQSTSLMTADLADRDFCHSPTVVVANGAVVVAHGERLTRDDRLSTVVDAMPVDQDLLDQAMRTRDHLIELQHERDLAQVSYQHAIRRLHATGASLREIADALGLSYQRVHQLVDVSTGKGALKQREPGVACAFCGLERSEVGRVIAGPGLFICDRCVELAAEVLANGQPRSEASRWLALVASEQTKARCGFCGKRPEQAPGIVEAPTSPAVGKLRGRQAGVRICGECVELCLEIFADALTDD